jgi:hypothetical protein
VGKPESGTYRVRQARVRWTQIISRYRGIGPHESQLPRRLRLPRWWDFDGCAQEARQRLWEVDRSGDQKFVSEDLRDHVLHFVD